MNIEYVTIDIVTVPDWVFVCDYYEQIIFFYNHLRSYSFEYRVQTNHSFFYYFLFMYSLHCVVAYSILVQHKCCAYMIMHGQ